MFNKKKTQLNDMELAAFCKQIGMIVSAGLPAYQGISILMDDTDNEATLQLLSDLFTPMQEGSALSFALRETGLFPEYMVHMIELGEETGRLEESLLSLSFYYEREAAIHNSIKHAVTYPLIMIIMMLAVIVVLVAKVLPVFTQIYEELGSEITGFGQVLIHISSLLNRYMLVFVVAFFVILLLGLLTCHFHLGQKFFQRRRLSQMIASSRFANCMYLVLASGLDTDHGLLLASQLMNNPYMQEKIHACQQLIKDGGGFSKSVLASGIFSKMYSSWITIGETTGGMDDVMKQICESYEEETDETIGHYISILEPTLVIILSLIIGLILISFLLPLLAIMSSIG